MGRNFVFFYGECGLESEVLLCSGGKVSSVRNRGAEERWIAFEFGVLLGVRERVDLLYPLMLIIL